MKGINGITHILVYDKRNGLLKDEFTTIPPKIEDHIIKDCSGKKIDCFCFTWASGNSNWYSNKAYRYEYSSSYCL